MALSLRKWLGELRGEAITETQAGEEKNSRRGAAGSESVLDELVSELMRKGVLAERIGGGMLQRLASAA